MNAGDSIEFTFPSDLTLGSSPSCSAVTSVTSVTCTVTGTNKIKMTMNTFSPTILPASTAFTFSVNNLVNPYSTKPTGSFTTITGYNAAGFSVQ